VIKCAKGIGGEPICHAHAIPFFDTREYEVEFTDGTVNFAYVSFSVSVRPSVLDNEPSSSVCG
jgi:hypothetical protein